MKERFIENKNETKKIQKKKKINKQNKRIEGIMESVVNKFPYQNKCVRPVFYLFQATAADDSDEEYLHIFNSYHFYLHESK